MRKLVLFPCLLVLMALGVTTSAATEDLTQLADFYSEDALIFASVRTDADFLDDLDTLFNQFIEFLPADQQPPISLLDFLRDNLSRQNVDLDADILSWLGDAAALGLPGEFDLTADVPPILAVVQADGPAALAALQPFLASEIDSQRYTIGEESGFIVYTPLNAEADPVIAFGEEIILIGTGDAVTFTMPDAPLSASENFIAAMEGLPADDYAALVYLDNLGLQSTVQNINTLTLGSDSQPTSDVLTTLSSTTQYIAFGATGLDERTLAIDLVQQANLDAYEELGFELFIPSPVNPDFLARVPEDALALIQGSDFGPANQSSLDGLRTVGAYLQENGGVLQLADPTGFLFGGLSPEEARLLEGVDVGAITGLINTGFAGLTGLSLERDVLPVLDGDAAFYLRLEADEDFFLLPALPDFGLIVGTSDGAAAQDLITAFSAASDAYDSGYELEDFGTGQALNIDIINQAIGFGTPSLDLLIGADDDVFVFGTRNAAQRALQAEGGLATDSTFAAASAYFVADAQSVFYLNLQPAGDLIIELVESGDIPPDPLLPDVLRLLSVVESASISSSVNADGFNVSRIALTVGAEPLEVEFANDVAMLD